MPRSSTLGFEELAAVAALFTLGFAPIIWFLRATMANGDWIEGDVADLGLLAIGCSPNLRPFFGIASLTGEPPFWLGDEPTATGARNFYEVVWQFLQGVSLSERAGR